MDAQLIASIIETHIIQMHLCTFFSLTYLNLKSLQDKGLIEDENVLINLWVPRLFGV